MKILILENSVKLITTETITYVTGVVLLLLCNCGVAPVNPFSYFLSFIDANVPYALSDFLFTMLAGSHNVEDWDPPENSSPIVDETNSADGTQTASSNRLPPFVIRISRHKPTAEVNDRKLRKQVR